MDELMKSSSRYGSASADEALMHCSQEHAQIEQEQRLVRGHDIRLFSDYDLSHFGLAFAQQHLCSLGWFMQVMQQISALHTATSNLRKLENFARAAKPPAAEVTALQVMLS